jgi:hypothetical protein
MVQDITYASDNECAALRGFTVSENSRPDFSMSATWRMKAKAEIVSYLGGEYSDQNNILKGVEIDLWCMYYDNMASESPSKVGIVEGDPLANKLDGFLDILDQLENTAQLTIKRVGYNY